MNSWEDAPWRGGRAGGHSRRPSGIDTFFKLNGELLVFGKLAVLSEILGTARKHLLLCDFKDEMPLSL
jgi:hypothetical protein